MFRAPRDVVTPEKSLAPGTVDIVILNSEDKPIPGAPITLGILENTVERGESQSRVVKKADANGHYRFTGLKYGAGVSYRVITNWDLATFRSQPFGLRDTQGVRVRLHSYEPVLALKNAAVVMEVMIVLDIKQDSIAVLHRLRTLNLGRKAFVAQDLRMRLPPGARAFSQQDSMTGVAVVEKDGFLELTGTFPPGQEEVVYRYNIDLESSSQQRLSIPLPPRVVQATIMASAGKGMGMTVAGFPQAQIGRRRGGQRVLQTTRQADLRMGVQALMSKTSSENLDITLTGLPAPGYARIFALLIALGAAAGSLLYLRQAKSRESMSADQRAEFEEARDALLDELVVLEKAHRAGDVGPKSYERLKIALLDALARIVTRLEHGRRRVAHRAVG